MHGDIVVDQFIVILESILFGVEHDKVGRQLDDFLQVSVTDGTRLIIRSAVISQWSHEKA